MQFTEKKLKHLTLPITLDILCEKLFFTDAANCGQKTKYLIFFSVVSKHMFAVMS